MGAGEVQFPVAGVADVICFVEGLEIHRQRLELAMQAVAEGDGLSCRELVLEGEPRFDRGAVVSVCVEVYAMEAADEADRLAEAVLELRTCRFRPRASPAMPMR
jgi:hypothetical protein